MPNQSRKIVTPQKRARGRQLVPRFKRRTKPGAPPGTLVADPDALRSTLNVLVYGSESIDEQTNCSAADLPAHVPAGKVVWVDMVGLADAALVERIGTHFGFHLLALEDVVNVHQRPKLEDYEDHVYAVLRMVIPGKGAETEQLSIFLSRGLVFTVQERPGDCFDPVRDRLRRGTGRIRTMQADYLFYALIDAVIDGYYPMLERFGEALEALEDDVLADPAPDQVQRLHSLKRDLLTIRRAIWPVRDVLNSLLRDENPLITDAIDVFLRDAYDHTIQLMDIVETYREIASGLIDAYLSSLSTKMNEIMKVLTIMATVFLPLTFITGLYGMNFDRSSAWNMPELGWRFGYLFSLGAMLASIGSLLYYFWRKGWIGRRRRD